MQPLLSFLPNTSDAACEQPHMGEYRAILAVDGLWTVSVTNAPLHTTPASTLPHVAHSVPAVLHSHEGVRTDATDRSTAIDLQCDIFYPTPLDIAPANIPPPVAIHTALLR